MKDEDMKQEIPDFTNKENLNLTYAPGIYHRNAYSKEEIYEIEALLNQGLKLPQIARKIGRTYCSIKQEYRAHKINGKYNANYSWERKLSACERQKKKTSTQEEDFQNLMPKVLDLLKKGYTTHWVRSELHIGFYRFKRILAAIPKEEIGKIKGNMIDMIDGLQQQIDILFDLIKEMKNGKD